MFSTRSVNHKINRPHGKRLTALLNDETSTFNDMLWKSNDTTIHVKNILKLMIEFYKYLYGLSAPIMKEVFTKRILKHNLRNCRVTLLPNPITKKCGTDTVAHKTIQIWSRYQRVIKIFIVRFTEIQNKKLALYQLPLQDLSNFCWWYRFYKLTLRAIAKWFTCWSINILAVFEISPENSCYEVSL